MEFEQLRLPDAVRQASNCCIVKATEILNSFCKPKFFKLGDQKIALGS